MGNGIVAKFMRLVPEPVTATTYDDTIDEQEYLKLAKKAGYDATAAIAERQMEIKSCLLRNFLAENGICVYPENKVIRYMNSVTPAYHRWTWRRVDRSERSQYGPYSKPIPEAVLMTMVKIREAFPDGVVFEVTDIEMMPAGDPFLRVRIKNTQENFIIERWNEPRFRM